MIIMPNLTNAGVQAQHKSCEANKKVILAQAEAYFLENGQEYPGEVEDLVGAGYLRDAPICPVEMTEESYSLKKSEVIDEKGNKKEVLVIKCKFHDKES